MRKRIFLPVLLLVVSCGLFASDIKKGFTARGYVLEMESVSKFDLDDYEVLCLPTTRVKIELKDGTLLGGACRPEAIRVGAELEVTGDYSPSTEQIEATEIVMKYEAPELKTSGTALIEKPPSIQMGDKGWAGTMIADGRQLKLTPETQMRFAEQKGESITSPAQVTSNVWVAYSGTKVSDGSVQLEQIAFSRNVISKKEQKFRTKYDAAIVAPNFATHTAGEVTAKNLKPLKIIPDQAVQEWIQSFGASLVPEFQRQLSDQHPSKIHYRFFVVDGSKYAATHRADGSVFVSAGILNRLKNDAQLAGVLSAEIASITEEQDFRLNSKAEWSNALCWGSIGASFLPMGMGLPISGMNLANYYNIRREMNHMWQQAGRVGLEYAMDAGFDPREVRAAYKALSKKTDAGMRVRGDERAFYAVAASEATLQLASTYSATDFTKQKVDAEDYERFLKLVNSATK